MTPDEARHVERLLNLCALPGVAAPADPAAPGGEWRIYDQDGPERRDITTEAIRATRAVPGHGMERRSAGRGFIVPRTP